MNLSRKNPGLTCQRLSPKSESERKRMGKAGVMNIVDTVGNVLFTSALTVLKDVLLDAVSKKAERERKL